MNYIASIKYFLLFRFKKIVLEKYIIETPIINYLVTIAARRNSK
jgi:hypothetical protein